MKAYSLNATPDFPTHQCRSYSRHAITDRMTDLGLRKQEGLFGAKCVLLDLIPGYPGPEGVSKAAACAPRSAPPTSGFATTYSCGFSGYCEQDAMTSYDQNSVQSCSTICLFLSGARRYWCNMSLGSSRVPVKRCGKNKAKVTR